MPKVPGWSTISGGSVHTLMDKIAHNPLRFGEGFGPELQTRVRKTTNVADARERRLDERWAKRGLSY